MAKQLLSRDNNFDLIRLLAAIQVFVMHAIAWLNVSATSEFMEVADWFPGVPIFFMISGYLVTASFAGSPTVFEYLRNRTLRIIPGLWVCLAIAFALVAVRGGLAQGNLPLKSVLWFLANGTVFQFVGAVGTGVSNGPLWSIATEAQFYLLIPAVGMLTGTLLGRPWLTAVLLGGIVLSGGIHEWTLSNQATLHPWLYPVLYASIFANGYLFLLGVLAYVWRDRLVPFVSGRVVLFVALYVLTRVLVFLAGYSANMVHSSIIGVAIYPLLALLVFSAAYSFIGLSRKLLRGNDFSYGLYIYHMPIIYALIDNGLRGEWGFLMALMLVAVLAAGSWFMVERPMLRHKRYSAHQAAPDKLLKC